VLDVETVLGKWAVVVVETVGTPGIVDPSPRVICTRRRCGGGNGGQGILSAVHGEPQVASTTSKETVWRAVSNPSTFSPCSWLL
jgi:hypothetical protein